MNISPINLFKPYTSTSSFRGKIIDSHVHTGRWGQKVFGAEAFDCFIKEPLNVNIGDEKQTDTVEKMLVSNIDCMVGDNSLGETSGNLAMLNICKKNPKLFPLAVCQPNRTNGNPKNIKNILDLNKGKFIGLKFHPEGLPLAANDSRYDEYLNLAEKKKLPCLFHSQVNVNWQPNEDGVYIPHLVEDVAQWDKSDPEFIYELAKRHPKVPVILAHTGAGGAMAHKKAIDVIAKSIDRDDAKLYCDISWMDFENNLPSENPQSLLRLIHELRQRNALDRVLFGTDVPLGCYGENLATDGNGEVSSKEAYERTVSSIKTAIKKEFGKDADNIIQKIFYDNAENLFFPKRRKFF